MYDREPDLDREPQRPCWPLRMLTDLVGILILLSITLTLLWAIIILIGNITRAFQ